MGKRPHLGLRREPCAAASSAYQMGVSAHWHSCAWSAACHRDARFPGSMGHTVTIMRTWVLGDDTAQHARREHMTMLARDDSTLVARAAPEASVAAEVIQR
jgi:hypothetical protein